jgi:hypothetical protein
LNAVPEMCLFLLIDFSLCLRVNRRVMIELHPLMIYSLRQFPRLLDLPAAVRNILLELRTLRAAYPL